MMSIEKGKRLKFFWIYVLVSVLIGVLINSAYQRVSIFLTGKEIKTSVSPDSKHTASLLVRDSFADKNLIVEIDGKTTYVSPDLCVSDNSFQERLFWDKSGRIIVLELMQKKVFAYDVDEGRELRKGESAKYEFSKLPENDYCVSLRDIDE